MTLSIAFTSASSNTKPTHYKCRPCFPIPNMSASINATHSTMANTSTASTANALRFKHSKGFDMMKLKVIGPLGNPELQILRAYQRTV